ncbi:MAG TPA: hypothetical protein VK171_01405 [Fimbriimonas sp.]|nr:hypothetical protein [Fimbriimonas sp.]
MRIVAISALFALTTGVASAQVSGLLNYPTPDVVGHREFQFSRINVGSGAKLSGPHEQCTNWVLGLFGKSEISGILDNVGNAQTGLKFTPWSSETNSLGFGIQDFRGPSETPFVSFRHSAGNWNGYLGWQKDQTGYGIAGLDFTVSDRFCLATECSTAAQGQLSFGLFYNLSETFSVTAIWSRPNNGLEAPSHQILFNYAFKV